MILKVNKFYSLFIFILFFMLLFASEKVALGAKNGIDLCLSIVIPAIFPFTVLSLMFLKSGGFYYLSKLIGVKYAIWLLSSIGGYPSGALIIKELEKSTDKSFLSKASIYAVNAGPSFIIAAVGIKVFNNLEIGVLLLFTHLIISFIFCIFSKKPTEKILIKADFSSPFSTFFDSLETGLKSILKICGIIIFISCFFELLKEVEFLKYICFIFEVTIGVAKAQKNLYFIAFLLSFGGISVIMQVKIILKDLVDIKRLFLYRLLHGVLSAILLWIIGLFYPISIETISNNVSFNKSAVYLSYSAAMALVFMCIIFITQILRQKNNRESSRLKFNN